MKQNALLTLSYTSALSEKQHLRDSDHRIGNKCENTKIEHRDVLLR